MPHQSAQSSLPHSVCLGEWQLDTVTGELSAAGQSARLDHKPLQVLKVLIERAGEVVSRESFQELVWADTYVTDDTLNKCISGLRAALNDQKTPRRYIETLPKRGYRLICEVSAGASEQPQPVTQPRPPKLQVPNDVNDNSIAVLPFVNFSDDPSNEFFSDGVSEEILNSLSQVSEFKVVARTSSFAFKGRNEDLRQIGAVLGVANVLEGSVRRAGNRVRITAQLIETENGYHRWSKTYDHEMQDIFVIQDAIAEAVADALKQRLLEPLRPSHTTGPDNYALYLRALHFLNSGELASSKRSLALFRQVVEQDPGYAPGWAGVANACFVLWGYLDIDTDPDQVLALAKEATEKAVAIDDRSADAHICRAHYAVTFDHDWAQAVASLRQARQLAPGTARGWLETGYLQRSMGHLETSVACFRKTLVLDPLNFRALSLLVISLIGLDRYDEALAVTDQALDLNPNCSIMHMQRGVICFLTGRIDAGVEEMRLEPPSFWHEYSAVLALIAQQRIPEAERAFEVLIETEALGGAFQMAEICCLLDDIDGAFGWLEQAFTERDSGLTQLFTSTQLRALYDDPRWAKLVERRGLQWPVPPVDETLPII